MFYVWIHRLHISAGDLKVPFTNLEEALEFGTKFVAAQNKSFYDSHKFDKDSFYEEGEFFIGGCKFTQVAIITDYYEPESGWGFWANAYYIVTQEKAMSLGGTEPVATPFAIDPWEK
jgi:hypothetical protein